MIGGQIQVFHYHTVNSLKFSSPKHTIVMNNSPKLFPTAYCKTWNSGILLKNSRCTFCFTSWILFIAAILHSKRRPIYGRAYRWIVNTLSLQNPALGYVWLILCVQGPSGIRHQFNQLPTTVANNLIYRSYVVGCM